MTSFLQAGLNFFGEATGGIAIAATVICGEGPQQAFACARCKADQFEFVTRFFFWPASVDLVEDEAEEFECRAQDLFNEFVAHGHCQGCGAPGRFTDFGKL